METLKLLEKYQSENQSREPPSFLEINDPNGMWTKLKYSRVGLKITFFNSEIPGKLLKFGDKLSLITRL